ncbi:MAG TPA: carbonic anhydrase, partial [Bacteroidia bacterium]|nr:carbonic anhydrase [Bacteroidia bacterium]
KTSIVQNAWRSGQKLFLHGLVYDIANGYLKDLDVTMDDPDKLPSYYLLDQVAVVK